MAKALTEAENIKAASLTRQLQDTFDAYGVEIVAQDQHYADELTKLKKLQDEKLITISKFNEVKQQLEAEHQTNIANVVEKFHKQDADSVLKAQNELFNLRNQTIQNDIEKQIAVLKQQAAEKLQQLDVEGVALLEQLTKQQAEIKYLRDHGGDEEATAITSEYNLPLKSKGSWEKRGC